MLLHEAQSSPVESIEDVMRCNKARNLSINNARRGVRSGSVDSVQCFSTASFVELLSECLDVKLQSNSSRPSEIASSVKHLRKVHESLPLRTLQNDQRYTTIKQNRHEAVL